MQLEPCIIKLANLSYIQINQVWGKKLSFKVLERKLNVMKKKLLILIHTSAKKKKKFAFICLSTGYF